MVAVGPKLHFNLPHGLKISDWIFTAGLLLSLTIVAGPAAANRLHEFSLTATTFPLPASLAHYNTRVQSPETGVFSNDLVELGISNQWGIGASTFRTQDPTAEQGFVRLETAWLHNRPERGRSLRLGDSTSRTGAWGDAMRFGGLQWSNNFVTRPADIHFSLPNVADELVIRDMLGQEKIISQAPYLGNKLLRAGQWDYSYGAGFLRQKFGTESNRSGPVFAAGTQRYGFTQRFTGGIHAQIREDRQVAGLSGVYHWPRLGTFNVAAAGSESGQDRGRLLGMGFARNLWRAQFDLQTQFLGEDFARLSRPPEARGPYQATRAELSLPLPDAGTVSLNYVSRRQDVHKDRQFFTAGYGARLGGYFFLSLLALCDLDEKSDHGLRISLSYR